MDARPETRVVTTHVPRDLADKLDTWATRIDRSRAWIMKQALAAWVDEEEERYQGTLEAMEDARAGRVIDHETVMTWLESLDTDNPLPTPKPPAKV